VAVSPLRSARTAAAYRAQVIQDGRPILEATVWAIGDVEGLQHDVSEAPPVPGPDALKSVTALLTEAGLEPDGPAYPFWNNVETRPIEFRIDWPPPEPQPPVWRQWCRFAPTPTFGADPWVDACRSLILVDIQSWPSASRQHAAGPPLFFAPSLDLYVAFHDPQPAEEWLLCDGYAPVAADGLMGWNGRLWSTNGHLVASGAGQLLCRRLAPPQAPA
jgi:acyl-CoA thioesterase-2